MKHSSPPLLEYESNFTSQCGEDGIIDYALKQLPSTNRWCVDVGAWDGKYLSNTYTPIERLGFSAVLIEVDKDRFSDLKRTYASRPDVVLVNRLVGFENPDSLDNILAETSIPLDFDFLSIDVDGNDYHIWDSLVKFRPKIVVIEFNPTMPNDVDFVQARDIRVSAGSSLAALYRLARTKDYRLIHATAWNAIFVDSKYFSLFNIVDDDPAALRANMSFVTYMFQTYDGKIHIEGNKRLLWHNVPFGASTLQVIPRVVRQYPPLFSLYQRICWRLYVCYLAVKGFFTPNRAADL